MRSELSDVQHDTCRKSKDVEGMRIHDLVAHVKGTVPMPLLWLSLSSPRGLCGAIDGGNLFICSVPNTNQILSSWTPMESHQRRTDSFKSPHTAY